MILKNLKFFLQHILKNKLYSFITIFGFSVSLLFVLLLSIYIKKEFSVDQFQQNKDKIYRLVHEDYSGFAPPSGPLLLEKFPEIQSYTRTRDQSGYISGAGTEKLKADYLLTDSSFFTMFSFKLIKGQTNKVLQSKNSIVLSRSFAYKLFGRLPELGETVKLNDSHDLTITGIVNDFPEETHFKKFDALLNFQLLEDIWGNPELLLHYSNNSFGLYLMAKENTNLPSKAPEILKLFKEVNWMFKKNYAKEIVVEPLTDIYFGNSFSPGIKQTSKSFLQILSGIIFMILILSIINYVNLTIAQSSFRCKEIAIKKLIGGKKRGLLIQSLSESILLSFFSFLIALLLCFQVEPVFNYLLDTNLEFKDSFTWEIVIYAFFFVFLTGVVSGIIPAIKIAGFNPLDVLKGKFRMKEKNIYSRILISFQYLIIISLISSSLFINKQTRFLRNYELGFEKDNLICIDNNISSDKQEVFKEILENIPGVEHVCLVCGTPLDGGNNNSFTYNDKQLSFQTFMVDTSFFAMMGIDVRPSGVAYSKDMFWLNESAVKVMELPQNPLSVKIYNTEHPVYGIVKDFHFDDLRRQIGPAYFQLMTPEKSAWSILVKINGQSTFSTIEKIKQAYDKFTEGIPMEIGFFNETVSKWYDREEKIGKIVKYFALLTIIISVMGLFAMSLYYVQQKNKEIGIRKVNGAKTHEIISMLNKDFAKWVAIAFVLACPVAYYAMHKWLENFAYKTELSWWIFALAGLIAMGIALLTVSFQSWRAATRNPVESLRYE